MPERRDPKIHPHPAAAPGIAVAPGTGPTTGIPAVEMDQTKGGIDGPIIMSGGLRSGRGPAYAELAVTTNFTFLTGASHPEELVTTAAALGHTAAAICDLHSLAGIVRAHVAAKEQAIPLAIGSRLRLLDAPGVDLLLYPADRSAYARLCRLLTLGKRRTTKGEARLRLEDVLDHAVDANLLLIVVPPRDLSMRRNAIGVQSLLRVLTRCRQAGLVRADRLSLAACTLHEGLDGLAHRKRVRDLGRHFRTPQVAINEAHYHVPERRALQDVLTCIQAGCTLDEAGHLLHANTERRLKSPAEMALLFADAPEALARAAAIAAAASRFSLDELKYEYPDEIHPPGVSSFDFLVDRTWAGARWRYPQGIPSRVRSQIEHEFDLIADLRYAPYFLTVYDIIQFARERNILCQGRGAAANSAVCYCLGITSVDPGRFDLLVERFISHERNEPPDIDVDFEHERREEVVQYIYQKYGRDRAALTAEVISYRGRSAIREVGKALGLSLDLVDRLAKNLDWWDKDVGAEERWREQGLDPHDPTIRRLVALAGSILGFPRHLSQHVGGFVITRSPLCELVPIENAAMEDRTIIEWDKDDIEAMGMLKIDLLCLGMLTCIHKAFDLLEHHENRTLSLATVPAEDTATYDMICRADTVGVFQIESRAQMSMLPRLRPRSYYDLVIEVAIVRPGPIQGEMVHPYLRRRNGEEPVVYPDERVQRVLGKTLGVPLFQEQAMSLAIVAGGFTAGQAEQLRRAMAGWRRNPAKLHELGAKLMQGMIERGYTHEYAQQSYNQLKGFSEYGFPESHAASFALLAYVSAWLKCHHPAVFAAALINSQPMGFYAPAQIVRDAREHGVPIRPVDVSASAWDCTLEPIAENAATRSGGGGDDGGIGEDREETGGHAAASPWALRLGLRLVRGLKEAEGRAMVAAVARQRERRHRQRPEHDDGHHYYQKEKQREQRGPEPAGALLPPSAVSSPGSSSWGGSADDVPAAPFRSIEQLWRASGVMVSTLKRLAEADAFRSMGLTRQQALWQVQALHDEPLPLFDPPATSTLTCERSGPPLPYSDFDAAGEHDDSAMVVVTGEPEPSWVVEADALPMIEPHREVAHDYQAIGLSLKAHPVSFYRDLLQALQVTKNHELRDQDRWCDGRWIAVAGVVLIRQRPSTASGIVFMTIEDESGVANLVVRPAIYERFRRAARHGVFIIARGRVERQGTDVVHVHVRHMENAGDAFTRLEIREMEKRRRWDPTLAADSGRSTSSSATTTTSAPGQKQLGEELLIKSRNFH